MKKLARLMVATAMILGGAMAANACDNLAASVSCAAISPGPGLETWVINFNDTGCDCDEVRIYVKSGCTGDWSPIAVLDCGKTQYKYIGSAGDNQFKIERWYNGSPNQTAVTGCQTCN